MRIGSSSLLGDRLRSVLSAVQSTGIPVHEIHDPPPKPTPFITISRQAGAGGETVAARLVERLNVIDPGETPWTMWDRELIEKVATDYHLAAEVVASLENSARNWLEELFSGMSCSSEQQADELAVYHRVAATIQQLARAGRVVIVGRAGVFITRKLPGGVHVRLVAPHESRVQHMMDLERLSRHDAEKRVDETDRIRKAFYHRYWPNESLAIECFTIGLNTAHMNEQQMAECILPLVHVAAHR